MKKLLMVSMLMFASSAFAGEVTSFGKIVFQSASSYVPANKVCQSNGYLYHKTKRAVVIECQPKDGCDGDYSKPLIQPMESSKTFCVKYSKERCLETGVSEYNQGTVEAKVYRSEIDMDRGRRPISTYSYTVDQCN